MSTEVMIPSYHDWGCVDLMLEGMSPMNVGSGISVFVVNDGSAGPAPELKPRCVFRELVVLHLVANRDINQQGSGGIAVGLIDTGCVTLAAA